MGGGRRRGYSHFGEPRAHILPVCCAGAVLLAAAPSGATPPLPGERIAAGMSAAGVDLSGATVDEAASASSP